MNKYYIERIVLGLVIMFLLPIPAINASEVSNRSVIQLTDSTNCPWWDKEPTVNEKGDVVWNNCNFDEDDTEIFLYNHKNANVIQLTDNNEGDHNFILNNKGDVLWECWDGNDWEACLYDSESGTATQISNNSGLDKTDDAQLNDRGDAVWRALIANGWSAYLYDHLRETVILLPYPTNLGVYPQLNKKGDVSWNGGVVLDGDRFYGVFLYESKSQTIVQVQLGDRGHQIRSTKLNDRGDVAWKVHDATDNSSRIFLYDNESDTVINLADNEPSCSSPNLNNKGDVVWNCHDGNDYEVFMYDGVKKTVIQITDNDKNDGQVLLNNKGDVVWVNRDISGTLPQRMASSEIFLYNRGDETIVQLTDNNYRDANHQLDEKGNVAWMGNIGNDAEVFLYDREKKTTIQLTDNDYGEVNLKLGNKGDVVWEERRDGEYHGVFLSPSN